MKHKNKIIVVGIILLAIFLIPVKVKCPDGLCLSGPNPITKKACLKVVQKPLIANILGIDINYTSSSECS